MKKTVNQSGITLIALVVTIVVLLILAGITITYVLAEGGLFDRAKGASKAQEMAVIRDYISNAQAELMIENAAPSNPAKSVSEIITDNFPNDGTYGGTFLTNGPSDTNPADGKLDDGEYTVTVTTGSNTNTYDVVITSGIVTVSDPTGEADGSASE